RPAPAGRDGGGGPATGGRPAGDGGGGRADRRAGVRGEQRDRPAGRLPADRRAGAATGGELPVPAVSRILLARGGGRTGAVGGGATARTHPLAADTVAACFP